MVNDKNFDLHAALQQISYLNLIIVSAAAAPERLPYIQAHPEIDLRAFHQQTGSLVCLLQTHLTDLSNALRGTDKSNGHFAAFRPLIADTSARIQSGAQPLPALHRHLRNVFAFEEIVHADQRNDHGIFRRDERHDYGLALAWLFETLSCLECGFKLHEVLGEAQNTDVCTRLCFGDAVNALETWRRDLQLILPGSSSIM